MKYYRQDKETGIVEEVTRKYALDRLINSFDDPVLALDKSDKDCPANALFAYYWQEEE